MRARRPSQRCRVARVAMWLGFCRKFMFIKGYDLYDSSHLSKSLGWWSFMVIDPNGYKSFFPRSTYEGMNLIRCDSFSQLMSGWRLKLDTKNLGEKRWTARSQLFSDRLPWWFPKYLGLFLPWFSYGNGFLLVIRIGRHGQLRCTSTWESEGFEHREEGCHAIATIHPDSGVISY